MNINLDSVLEPSSFFTNEYEDKTIKFLFEQHEKKEYQNLTPINTFYFRQEQEQEKKQKKQENQQGQVQNQNQQEGQVQGQNNQGQNQQEGQVQGQNNQGQNNQGQNNQGQNNQGQNNQGQNNQGQVSYAPFKKYTYNQLKTPIKSLLNNKEAFKRIKRRHHKKFAPKLTVPKCARKLFKTR
eukprot:Pgem_evm1s4270